MLRTLLTPIAVAATLGAAGHATAQTPAAPLTVQALNADANSFHVNSVVVSGKSEAMVIDAGFTRADALRIAAAVLDSGRRLTTILVSNADPDYYFGAETLVQIFPEARVVATPAVAERIRAKADAKLAFWGPKMGANAPAKPVLPGALATTTLTVDGQAVELRGTSGLLAHRPYVWIPSIRTVAGALGVIGGLHLWTADTPSAAERLAWRQQLDEIAALQPSSVVPGHMKAGSALDASSLAYTREYLARFDDEAKKAANAAALIETMKRLYPDAAMALSLDIGAKVVKGEMKW
jgi:glyoxylase-like metal-dependent hydrolase (beta-lactamase superfamily II)